MNLFTKWKQIQRHRKQLMITKGERGGRINQEFEININTILLIYIKQINNKILYSTGNYIHYPIVNHNGNEYEKEYIHILLNYFAIYQKLTQHCKSSIRHKKFFYKRFELLKQKKFFEELQRLFPNYSIS